MKQAHITDEDYDHAQTVYTESKCNNIKDYIQLYLACDVFLLVEVFERFRWIIFENFQLDPVNLLTISSLAIQASMLYNKEEFELLKVITTCTEFECGVRGGFTSVVQGKITLNNFHLSDYDSEKPISTAIFGDITSLYPTCMTGPLPVGQFKECSPEEVVKFAYLNADLKGEECYAMVVDFTIPDEIKEATDNLPLNLNQSEISFERLSPFMKNVVEKSGFSYPKRTSLLATHEDG